MSSNELNEVLEEKLIYYILLVDNTYTKDELKGCGLFWLVSEYCKIYAIPQESFYSCLADIVKRYKDNYPDDEFSDEEIYAIENAFDPANFFKTAEEYYDNEAMLYDEALKKAAAKISECEIDVIEEPKRLETARTSLEISEIKSDIAQANIAYERAKKAKAILESQKKESNEHRIRLNEKMALYYDAQLDNDDTRAIRLNSSKPE